MFAGLLIGWVGDCMSKWPASDSNVQRHHRVGGSLCCHVLICLMADFSAGLGLYNKIQCPVSKLNEQEQR